MGWWSKHWPTNQETIVQESRPLSSRQKSRICCVRTQDTEDVENLHPVINESKLKPYHHPVFPQQQETSLTLIAPSQESTTQEVEKILDSRRRYNTSLSGKDNPLKNQCGRIGERSSEEQRLCQEFHRSHPDAPGIPHNSNTREVDNEVVRMRPWITRDADHVIPYLE